MSNKPNKPDIIYRPELQSRTQSNLFKLITTGAWIVWLYLFLPLISFLAWCFGIGYFSNYMLNLDNEHYPRVLYIYALIILLSAVVIVAWSQYNSRRFKGKTRRKSAHPVTAGMLCEKFNIDRKTLETLQNSTIIEMDIDEHEVIRDVRPMNITALVSATSDNQDAEAVSMYKTNIQ